MDNKPYQVRSIKTRGEDAYYTEYSTLMIPPLKTSDQNPPLPKLTKE